MPAYHSVFNTEPNLPTQGNIPLPPLRTRLRGPAQALPALTSSDPHPLTLDPTHASYDPIDESLSLFRANCLFRNFEIQGPADRLLIYLILYTSSLLSTLKPSMGRKEGEKALMSVALDNNFKVPGDAGFPISGIFEAPRDRQGQDVLRGYLGQARQELAGRLLDRLYPEGRAEGGPDKWWMCYQRRKFMGKSL